MFWIFSEYTSIIPSMLERMGPAVCLEKILTKLSHYVWEIFETCSFQSRTKRLSEIKNLKT